MKIAKVVVSNYKLFKGEHIFTFNSELVFLVGENNTGKTSLFEAINFLKAGIPKDKQISDIKNKFAVESEHLSCTATFVGNIKSLINDFSESKYTKYIFEENGIETLRIKRSSENRSIDQSGKKVNLDVKKITVWNPESSQFENPAGIDSVISTLFETQFVWADTDPRDVSDFGSKKICGRLLNDAIGDFFQSEQWDKFTKIHEETFHGEVDSLGKRAGTIESQIKQILLSQYGVANIKFDFSLPETSTFFKSGEIIVDDGTNTKLEEKGTGMQRAVALAIIQVYAASLTSHPSDPKKSKPLFFFVDEPEICLHPKAQNQLLIALIGLSKMRQIFVSTHSPYMLRLFNVVDHDLLMFNRTGNDIQVTPAEQLRLFTWSPSLGEINYKAYQLCSVEFHNELYGYLQEREAAYNQNQVDAFFVSKGHNLHKDWIRVQNGNAQPCQKVTLMTFIRNTIHHPENKQNADFTEAELKQSIEHMMVLAH